MSLIEPPEPLEAFPFPDDAIVLAMGAEPDSQPTAGASAGQDTRALAVQALRQTLRQRRLDLPMGPEAVEQDAERLLFLNRFAVQLVDSGWLADELAVPMHQWQEPAGSPQLLLAALVDEENAVVQFPGVLTAEEWQKLPVDALPATASQDGPEGASRGIAEASVSPPRQVSVEAFRGGLERLLALVQLLDPEALPRFTTGLDRSAALTDELGRAALQVRDWLLGRLDPALAALGAVLEPPITPLAQGGLRSAEDNLGDAIQSAIQQGLGAIAPQTPAPSTPLFPGELRSGASSGGSGTLDLVDAADQALAVLAIPLGIGPAGELLSGTAASRCIERFRLLLIPSGSDQPTALLLRLLSDVPGDLLPNGLTLSASQGSTRQSSSTVNTARLDLRFPASGEVISVCLQYPGSGDLELPPLQMPRP